MLDALGFSRQRQQFPVRLGQLQAMGHAEAFRKLAAQKESRVEEGHLMPDHVHMMLSIPPKYAVSQVLGFIKGKSAIHLARVYAERKRNKAQSAPTCLDVPAVKAPPRLCSRAVAMNPSATIPTAAPLRQASPTSSGVNSSEIGTATSRSPSSDHDRNSTSGSTQTP